MGVLSGGGMTREAAFGKLNALMAQVAVNAEIRRLVVTCAPSRLYIDQAIR